MAREGMQDTSGREPKTLDASEQRFQAPWARSNPPGCHDVIVRVRLGSGALGEGPKIRPFERMPHDHSHRASIPHAIS
jgi:hypothetical protein